MYRSITYIKEEAATDWSAIAFECWVRQIRPNLHVLHTMLVQLVSRELRHAGYIYRLQVLELEQFLSACKHLTHEQNSRLVEVWKMILANHSQYLPQVSFTSDLLIEVLGPDLAQLVNW